MREGQPCTVRMSNSKSRLALVVFILASGFAAGWVAKRHVMFKQRSALSSEQMNLGDAPPSVRNEVLKQLKAFQAGTRIETRQVVVFMKQLFPPDRNIGLLGTDPNEWNMGYDSISQFIYADLEELGRHPA